MLGLIEKQIDAYLKTNHSKEFGIALMELKMAIQKIKKFL